MIAEHKLEKITFDKDHMYLHMEGQVYTFSLIDISVKLKNADEQERKIYQISPSGYGIHWPLIDEDLSVPELLKSIG